MNSFSISFSPHHQNKNDTHNIIGGWSSQILNEKLIQSDKDERNGRWYVGYLATVRVTLLNGVSHEDVGSGEGINDSKIKAHEKALKSAITDAMKRAARHFGERLGNALYVKGNGIRTAPKTNRDALMELERRDALNLFGDQKMAVSLRNGMRNESSGGSNNNSSSNGHQSLEENERAVAALASTSTTSLSTGDAASRSSNNNNNSISNISISNNINTNRSMMQTSAARPTPHPPQNPSPILSRGRAPLLAQQQQHHQVQQVQVGNVNGNQQNNHPQYQQQQQQQQQAMAPPPRPMYKPHVGSNTNSNNNTSQHQHQHTGVNMTCSSSDSVKRGLAMNDGAGGDASAKRQKLNPYNTNNKARLSV